MLQRQRDPSLHERVVSPLPCCYNSHPCCCSCSILASLIILVDAHVPSLRPSSSSVLLIMFNACERVVPCERVVAPLTVQETLMFDPCARVVAPCSSLLMLMFDPCERVVAPLTVQETLMFILVDAHVRSLRESRCAAYRSRDSHDTESYRFNSTLDLGTSGSFACNAFSPSVNGCFTLLKPHPSHRHNQTTYYQDCAFSL